jgi:hypothetical protein
VRSPPGFKANRRIRVGGGGEVVGFENKVRQAMKGYSD